MDRETVARWLDGYVAAWKSYDPQAIGDLFTEDARYFYDPFNRPVEGREAIIAAWLAEPDEPGTYDASYEPVLVEGNRAMAVGRSIYYEDDGTTVNAEWSNVFLLTFDDEGRCSQYEEWYFEKPETLDGQGEDEEQQVTRNA
jgi:ketosteroid isomerase-like protein